MNIGLVGYGFVGKAVEYALQGFNHDIKIIDPKWSYMTCRYMVDTFDPAFIFVCVPTPERADGSCDDSEIGNTLSILSDTNASGIVVIKSTVTPDKLKMYLTDYPTLNIVYNPEFLQQNTAIHDIVHPDIQILGGKPHETQMVVNFYDTQSRINVCPAFSTDLVTASLAKYAINSFLATKVTFMNTLHDIHDKSDTDTVFSELIAILANEPRIGSSHLQVPGPDGKFGYGGACFPKDVKAFEYYADQIGADSSLLYDVDKINQQFRDK